MDLVLEEEEEDKQREEEEVQDEQRVEGREEEEEEEEEDDWKGWLKQRKGDLAILFGVVAVIPFLFLEIGDEESTGNSGSTQARAAGVGCIMAIYWMTEAIPIPVTSLIPLFLFPVFLVLPSKVVATVYFNDVIILLLATNIVGLAMEKYRLHERIALQVLLLAGQSPIKVVAGVMLVTSVLSMFMSNTATSTVMAPLVVSLFASLRNADASLEGQEGNLQIEKVTEDLNEQERNFLKASLLATAYSASVGGVATLIGTPTNLVMISTLNAVFTSPPEISFTRWLLFCFPLVVCCLTLIFLWITFSFLRKTDEVRISMSALQRRLDDMGRLTPQETIILSLLGVMMILWLTRTAFSDNFLGWGSLFEIDTQICSCSGCFSQSIYAPGDSVVAIGAAILLFLLPTFERDLVTGRYHPVPGSQLLDWKDCQGISWGVILLLGAGYALARGFAASGLSETLGNMLYEWGTLPLPLFIFVCCLFVSFTTEFVSNLGVANLILPILAELAITQGENPLALLFPATISCSFAFMMPAATPANAIVFSYNTMKVTDMAKTGFLLDVCCVVLLALWSYFFLPIVWDVQFGQIPSWAIDSKIP